MKKISLKDIAKKVGVSTALVSYVLNNKKEGRINKEVAQKIRDTAKELNYRTNQIAKSLKTNKTSIIGLIVADIANSFSSVLARIIEDEAEKNNYTVIFGSSDESAEKSIKLINVLLNHQVDGLIIAPAEDAASQVLYLQQSGVPFVLIDRYISNVDVSYVAIDNYKASYTAVKHLIDNGSKRIGIVTFKSSLLNLQERLKGYINAMKDSDLTVDEGWIKEVNIIHTGNEVKACIDELLSLPQPVEAILFVSNTLSVSGLKYLNALKIKVPDDLAIVSFDQSDAADLFYAPLTHIRQPLQVMGQLATKLLFESMNKNHKITSVNLEAELIIGKSSIKKSVAIIS